LILISGRSRSSEDILKVGAEIPKTSYMPLFSLKIKTLRRLLFPGETELEAILIQG
jgi:hypothetical protein